MSNAIKQTPGYIVSNEVLSKKGRFTFQDILDDVIPSLESLFESIDSLRNYVTNKINEMCDLGLVSRTEVYYFSREN